MQGFVDRQVPGNHSSKTNRLHMSKTKIPDNYERAYKKIIFSSSKRAYNLRIILGFLGV